MRQLLSITKAMGRRVAQWLLRLTRAPETAVLSVVRSGRVSPPTVLHVTHWKAGSRWIARILNDCVPDRIVASEIGAKQLLERAVELGKVYPNVYVTREEFDKATLPAHWRRFVVIRDLRDTLISYYFSFKVSHPVIAPIITEERTVLQNLDHEEGLLRVMERWLPLCVSIQESWLAAGEPLIRYEDLIENDIGILENLLLDRCGLPVTRRRFRNAVEANRFEALTRGRPRGQEDVASHERKGIAGDWQNHFSDRVKSEFKARYGALLIATGYERNLDW